MSSSASPAGSTRMPVLFVPHGGGPWPFVELGFPVEETDALARHLRELPTRLASPPRALLVITSHWEAPVPTVSSGERPPLLYDYAGFPPAAYELTWPAPGDPELAARVRALLTAAGLPSASDPQRGFDHGTFVPMKVAFPDARLPTVQLSLVQSFDPALHLALGRALAPLRDEGVLIVGSGMTFHNLRALRDPRALPGARAFDAWLRETIELRERERSARLTRWSDAPSARAAHPREEHLLPLLVAVGAAGEDAGTLSFGGSFLGLPHAGFQFA